MRAHGVGPERIRREEDEAAAATRSDAPARILRLQASAGNQAVAQLLRVSSKGKSRLKSHVSGVKLSAMEDFQAKGGLSDADVDRMLSLGARLSEAMTCDPKKFKGCEEEIDVEPILD